MRALPILLISLPLACFDSRAPHPPMVTGLGGASATDQDQDPYGGMTARSADELEELGRRLLDQGLRHGQAYELLASLLDAAPKRLSGSDGYEDAVEWGLRTMRALGLQEVRKQVVWVPRWERGAPETAYATLRDGTRMPLRVCALGGSVATPRGGLTAQVVESRGLEGLGIVAAEMKGRIAFFSKPMDAGQRTTFSAYGGAVGQRGRGAIRAAEVGAVAVLVRSMSTAADDSPHTGAMRYSESVPKIPAFALGVASAERLSAALERDEVLSVTVESDCRTLPDRESANVIGEIPGSEWPEEIVVVGGHLDAWELGTGAHDDGAGIAHSLEAARLLLALNLRPKRTIRVILFANEENGLRGGRVYADEHKDDRHFFAFESDSGGFSPRGIALARKAEELRPFQAMARPLRHVAADRIYPGGGGADIGPLRSQGVPVGNLRPDDARYFDLHHSEHDNLAAVHPRELQLGAIVTAYWLAVIADMNPGALE